MKSPVISGALALGLAAFPAMAQEGGLDAATLRADAAALFEPIPDKVEAIRKSEISPEGHKITPEKVDLGRSLFFDPRMSKSGLISCQTCHNAGLGGADGLPTSIGHGWQKGPRNAPTAFNSVFNVAQFWDGRAADLKEQAGGPIANPGEMAFTHDLAVGTLRSIPGYVAEFKSVFGSAAINIDKVTQAIAAFEETLVTPNSPFDAWLKGDDKALTDRELAGYGLFKESGCVACHTAPAMGGTSLAATLNGRRRRLRWAIR